MSHAKRLRIAVATTLAFLAMLIGAGIEYSHRAPAPATSAAPTTARTSAVAPNGASPASVTTGASGASAGSASGFVTAASSPRHHRLALAANDGDREGALELAD